MTVMNLTWTSTDFAWQPEELEVPSYTDGEIAQALALKTLTAEQCLYLHLQGTSWQIEVNSQERKHQ